MIFDDIKKTLIQAIVLGDSIEVHAGEASGFMADTYAFGIPTAFDRNRDFMCIHFRNGGEARFAIEGVTEITAKHAGEWVERH